MTFTVAAANADPGSLFHLAEGLSGCPHCNWRGATPWIGGKVSHLCPACEVPETHRESAEKCDECGGVCIEQPMRNGRRWGSLRQGELYRPGAAVVAFPKAGRNEPCPCGSGSKFKKCHGRAA